MQRQGKEIVPDERERHGVTDTDLMRMKIQTRDMQRRERV